MFVLYAYVRWKIFSEKRRLDVLDSESSCHCNQMHEHYNRGFLSRSTIHTSSPYLAFRFYRCIKTVAWSLAFHVVIKYSPFITLHNLFQNKISFLFSLSRKLQGNIVPFVFVFEYATYESDVCNQSLCKWFLRRMSIPKYYKVLTIIHLSLAS